MANILAAKRIDAGCEVFAYTFASPATTVRTTDAAKQAAKTNYLSIFNIINEDDLVPQLPMFAWDFVRYGNDKSASIETSYANEWDTLTGLNYVHAETAQQEVIAELSDICADRHSCYSYPSAPTPSSLSNNDTYLSFAIATSAANAFTAQYSAVCSGTYRSVVYGSGISYLYYVEYKPAMLMMMMAEAMCGNGFIDQAPFALVDLPPYLDVPRNSIVSYALLGNIGTLGDSCAMEYPHYVESYYLLATKLS